MSRRKNKGLVRPQQSQPKPVQQLPPQTTHQQIISSQTFVGPIPPPDILSRYDQIHPGAANRIITMAEQEASHRQGLEREKLQADISLSGRDYDEAKRGQICAIIFGLAAIGIGSYTALHGAQVAGSIIGSGVLLSIITAFISGRRKDRKKQP